MFPNFLVDFDSGKIEKEKKKVAQEAGFLRTEVTGGEVSDRNGKYFHGQSKLWQIFTLTFRDLLILFLEQIKYVFFSLKKPDGRRNRKREENFPVTNV